MFPEPWSDNKQHRHQPLLQQQSMLFFLQEQKVLGAPSATSLTFKQNKTFCGVTKDKYSCTWPPKMEPNKAGEQGLHLSGWRRQEGRKQDWWR